VLRYRGAQLGLAWALLHPLLMLGVFGFVFGQIFSHRWVEEAGDVPFFLNLYVGLISFNLLGEPLSRATLSVRGNPSYVKKIVFPLGILPLVPVGTALVHGLVNFTILGLALTFTSTLHPTQLLIPLALLPLFLLTLGISWFAAAWGVFIKDIAQVVPVFSQILMFLSPVFYPLEAVPSTFRPAYLLNPITPTIETIRHLLAGELPTSTSWLIALAVGGMAAVLGYWQFQKLRGEFADVL
jgi:lipopolysaccharide transport system permease protein